MKRVLLLALMLMSVISIVSAQEVIEPTAEVALAETTVPGTITFSFKDADIRNVLRLIAAKSGINIVYGPEVTGVVNMELKDVPWEQALGLVLDLNGYAYQREGNVIKVLRKEDISKEPLSTEVFILNYATATEAVKAIEQMLTERGSIKTDARSNTIIVTDVPANINKIEAILDRLDSRTPQVLIETKIVEINNAKEKDLGLKWTSLKEYTVGLQSPTRTYRAIRRGGKGVWDDASEQVDTEGVTDTTTTSSTQTSGQGTVTTITGDPITGTLTSATQTDTASSALADSLASSISKTLSSTLLKADIRSAVLSAADFELVLSALESQTDVNLISNPRILTANNETAKIKVVQEYPIPRYTFDTTTSTFTIAGFDFKDIGVTFDVTPIISPDGYITMQIKPHTSVLLGTIPFTASGSTVNVPLIGVKEADAKLVIKSGDTLAVGGLVDEDKSTVITKIPLLGDLPILGRLFRHENVDNVKKDIIFFITATIIDEETKRLIYEGGIETTETTVETPPDVYSKVFKSAGDTDLSKGNRGYVGK